MRWKLTQDERGESVERLTEIAQNADVMADKIDPKRESKRRDGERYELARKFDAIYNLAKAALRQLSLE